jgi:hypothetical protein
MAGVSVGHENRGGASTVECNPRREASTVLVEIPRNIRAIVAMKGVGVDMFTWTLTAVEIVRSVQINLFDFVEHSVD